MAKDLHWFKFNISEYMLGDIIFCSDAAQGVFTRLMCLYWSRDCVLTRSQALKHLQGRDELLDELIKADVIKIEGDALRIDFLLEQKNTWTETSKKNSVNGAKGGRGNTQNKAGDKAKQKPGIKPNESDPESQMKANPKAKKSQGEGDKTSLSEKTEGSRYPDESNREPSTPLNPHGPGSGVAMFSDKSLQLMADFFSDIEGYKFKESQVREMEQEFDRIPDEKVEACYLQFRRKWKTEEGRKKTPKASDLIDLLFTYAMPDDNT